MGKKIAAIFSWIVEAVKSIFEGFLLLLKDFFLWIVDQIFTFTGTILYTASWDFSVFNPAAYIAGLPPEIMNMLALVRVPEALAIIISALIIRVTLQLIPFVRLGS